MLVGLDRRPQPGAHTQAPQVAMIVGFGTAHPVNWLLVRRGVKERR